MNLETEFAHAMRRAGLKQNVLADLVGFSRWTVARWMRIKNGRPAPQYAWTIVRLYQANIDLAAKLQSDPQ